MIRQLIQDCFSSEPREGPEHPQSKTSSVDEDVLRTTNRNSPPRTPHPTLAGWTVARARTRRWFCRHTTNPLRPFDPSRHRPVLRGALALDLGTRSTFAPLDAPASLMPTQPFDFCNTTKTHEHDRFEPSFLSPAAPTFGRLRVAYDCLVS